MPSRVTATWVEAPSSTRMEFAERADAEFQRVARTLDLAEVVVQGFVASLDAVGAGAIARGDYVRTARYARRVMEERPEVYAIEVVRRRRKLKTRPWNRETSSAKQGRDPP